MKTAANTLLLAALLMAAAPAVQAASLGRLFFSPAERAALDRSKAGVTDEVAAPAPPAEQPSAPLPPATINGFVKRSDGTVTVWRDSVPISRTGIQLNPSIVATRSEIVVRRSVGTAPRQP